MVKRIDGHIKGRAKNSLLAHLYSCACTRVAPSVMRPDGRSCLQAGNATVSPLLTDSKNREESQIDRQRDVGGSRGGFVCFGLFVLLMFDENTAAFSYFR